MTSRRLRSLFLAAAVGALAAATGGCATNPATGRDDFTLVSPAQERRIGAEAHPRVLDEFGVYEEFPGLNAYVATVASRLHGVSEMATEPFTFTLLDSDMVNAFAIPGGYVYVTRGLMALANNEAELAGVIGHEIGHVTARHGAQRMTRQVLAGLGVAAIGAALRDRAVSDLANTGAGAWIAGYSRGQELQSDELGVRYLTRAGYDPLAMASFLRQLGRHSELARRIAFREGEPDPAGSWFATHPRTEDRVVAAARLARAGLADPYLGRDEYLRRIDGMIWGDSPAQGFVRGRDFSHPELRLTFRVPDGFRMVNAPRRVTAFDRDGAAILFDGAADPGGPMTGYARAWADEQVGRGTRLADLERIDVNGMDAATGRLRLPLRQGDADVRFLAIRHGAGAIYRFVFIAPVARASALAEPFRRAAHSFRGLSPEEAAALKPLRVRAVEVRSGDTIDSLARLMQFDDLRRERFTVLNGLASEADLKPGMLVKIVRE